MSCSLKVGRCTPVLKAPILRRSLRSARKRSVSGWMLLWLMAAELGRAEPGAASRGGVEISAGPAASARELPNPWAIGALDGRNARGHGHRRWAEGGMAGMRAGTIGAGAAGAPSREGGSAPEASAPAPHDGLRPPHWWISPGTSCPAFARAKSIRETCCGSASVPAPAIPVSGPGDRGRAIQAAETGRLPLPPVETVRSTPVRAGGQGPGNKGLAAPALVPEHHAARFPAVAGKEG